MLYATPRLTADDERVLAEVIAMRDDLRHAVRQTPAKWTQDLRRALTASAIAASNTIEGVRVDVRDVADLMDGEREGIDVGEADKAETLAYQQTMTYIQSLYDVEDFTYSKGLLNALHWMLQGHHHTPGRPAGQWRRKPIFISAAGDPLSTEYEGPHEDRLPSLTGELVDWLNEGDLDADPLIRAAMAHLNLVKIHPWVDGNGRMSRSLQTLVIARQRVLAPEFSSIEEWLGMPGNTWDYYKVLREVGAPSTRRNVTPVRGSPSTCAPTTNRRSACGTACGAPPMSGCCSTSTPTGSASANGRSAPCTKWLSRDASAVHATRGARG